MPTINGLPTQTGTPTGNENVAVDMPDGTTIRVTTQQIADLGTGSIVSVNGQTGPAVTLDAADVAAIPAVVGASPSGAEGDETVVVLKGSTYVYLTTQQIANLNAGGGAPSYADNLPAIARALLANTATSIACFGDSTMWGADPNNTAIQVAVPPPASLQAILRSYFGNTAATVTNDAISSTTLAEMLAGTDGSGSTFAAKMAVSTASAIYCNHCINDAVGPSPTTAEVYKTNLAEFVRICRANSKTPVLCTPAPNWPIGGRALSRSEGVKQFAQVMRETAVELGVMLVDNYRWVGRMLESGKASTQDLILDGIHPNASTAAQIGRNFAIPLIAELQPFTAPNQFQVLGDIAQITTSSTVDALGSRMGSYVGSTNVAAQAMRILVLVEETGLDLYLATPMLDAGAANITLDFDGTTYNFSEYAAGYSSASVFGQDIETCIAEDVYPGLHLLELTNTVDVPGSNVVGAYYMRSRPKLQSVSEASKNSPTQRYRKLWLKGFELTSANADTVQLLEDFPTSRLLRTFEMEFTAQLGVNTGVTMFGFRLSDNAGPPVARQGLLVYLDGSGFLSLIEATASGSFTSTGLGAVDLSLASHVYRVTVSAAGSVVVYVDGTAIGAPYSMTTPLFGGFLGFWKFGAGGTLTISELSYIASV